MAIVNARRTGSTRAEIHINEWLGAGTTIPTRIGCTFTDISLTLQTRISRQTRAYKTVDSVGTRTTITTRIGSTFVDISLTENSGVAWNTRAVESIGQIFARCTIAARITLTFVHVSLTLQTDIT